MVTGIRAGFYLGKQLWGGGRRERCVRGKTQKLGGSGGMPARESWTLGLSEINSDAI